MKMIKVETTELDGAALDYAVAAALRVRIIINGGELSFDVDSEDVPFEIDEFNPFAHYVFSPSTIWQQGGPIIEREGIYLRARDDGKQWAAGALSINRYDGRPGPLYYAEAPLIAAMRCFVASKLGAEVEVPSSLVKQ